VLGAFLFLTPIKIHRISLQKQRIFNIPALIT
jgi:hypothetical protein